jgi:transcriptional regulator with XRE-family HTH domain
MAKTPRTPPTSPLGRGFGRGFGRFVRLLRKARGQTQEQLAERADLSSDTIRRLELGSFSPSLDTLTKLTSGLRIDFSALFVAFELREVGTDRELLAMARRLTPAELATAIRVLAVLADLLGGVADSSNGEGREDA